jgi:hypothetical protein
MSEDNEGRRRARRLPVHLEGSLCGRKRREVTLLDMSLTGCLVRCDCRLDTGAILDLSLEMARDPFLAKVRVTEASVDGSAPQGGPAAYLAGLEFLGLSARDEARLRRFLDDERRRLRADAASR